MRENEVLDCFTCNTDVIGAGFKLWSMVARLCSSSRSEIFFFLIVLFLVRIRVHVCTSEQEHEFGDEVDLGQCIERQRTKDWTIENIGSGKYRLQPEFSDEAPGRCDDSCGDALYGCWH